MQLKAIPFITLILLLSLSGVSWSLLASDDGVRLKSMVDRAYATTSDKVTFTIELIYPEGTPLQVPPVGDKIAGLRVVDFGQGPAQSREGLVTKRHYYILQADISGTYILPPLTLSYQDSQGKEKKLVTGEIFLEISAKTKSGDESEAAKDIRDIKGPIEEPLDWTQLLGWGGAIFLVLVLVGGLYWWQQRSKLPATLPSPPPRQVALEGLAQLRKQSVGGEIDGKGFSFSLSYLMREYIEGEFAFPATDRTLEEIGKSIDRIERISSSDRQEFYSILDRVELIKFADLPLIADQQLQLVERGEELVKKSSMEDSLPDGDEEESVI